uniref:Uncharacterized protein n=1 Tax=Bubo bubo TaxID=30461 RepID=A0A8C0EF82_BUBBB
CRRGDADGVALFTYEGNSNDLRVAGSGGERVRDRPPLSWRRQPRLGLFAGLSSRGPCFSQRTKLGGQVRCFWAALQGPTEPVLRVLWCWGLLFSKKL